MRRDHLGVGGDRAGDAQAVRDLEVGVVVDVAVERGRRRTARVRRRRCSTSSLLTGWALGSEMMPTLAQRVWPRTATRALGAAERQAQQAVVGDGGPQRARCCRRARRSRRPPCTRSDRPPAGEAHRRRSGTAGRAARSASAAATAGSSTSRPWSQTNTWMPAESRPRTSSRSIAESACWTAR